MLLEIRLKYYNSSLKIGFNNMRESVYDCNKKEWLTAKYHLGRIVYGKERLPYNRIKKGIDKSGVVVQEYCPF